MEIINTITSILTLLGIIFAVFFYFKNPQERLEKKQAIGEVKDKLNKQETQSDINLIAERIKLLQEQNDKKFCELYSQVKDSYTLATNHTHTVDTKVDELIKTVNYMGNKITKLSTIINERIPKKV